MATVITQVFPDEYHLHTLDQFLSATARLNPHVNIKAIVIGLMDRLSAYAARESESESPEERRKAEEDATTKLLEKLRVSKESKPADKPAQENGDAPEARPAESDAASTATSTTAVEPPEESAPTNGESKRSRGIPDNVKLFEIFHEQVASLVKLQRLPIQDTIALLVSLANLALLVNPYGQRGVKLMSVATYTLNGWTTSIKS